MRIRRASPLLLLLGPSLVAGGPEVLSNEEIFALNHPPKAVKAPQEVVGVGPDSKPTQTSKPYVGTEDAPVDGQDGKPHAGPFVDRTPADGKARKGEVVTTTSKSLPTSLDNFEPDALAAIPEKNDGVMNDENRPIPHKGTTGTEGGISEKDKARRVGQAEKKPQEPKEAPPLPHSEEERIDKADEKKGTKSSKDATAASRTGQDPITGDKVEVKKGDGYGESGYGMEKPTDLPEKPHDIPHPQPNVATDDFGPPVNVAAGRDKWLMDTMPETEGKTNRKPAKTTTTTTTVTDSTTTEEHAHHETWHEWFHSFVLSFTMIIFSEIGDKTFLVAALMAMRHSRTVVFTAALSALTAMTVLSAVLGHAFPALLPKRLTTFAAAILFFVFGAKSLLEGLKMDENAGVGEEMREVEAELEEKENSMRRKSKGDLLSPYELESGRGRSPVFDKMGRPEPSPPLSRSPTPPRRSGDGFSGLVNLCSLMLSPAWVQTFIMTFLGEWGDRSQIATIAMAAGQDYWWVTLGAIVGHACCTGVAVVGGRALAGRVSMRVVTIGGAVAFLVFGCIYLYECISE